MTAAGELSWPPAGSFLAAYGEVLMAADSPSFVLLMLAVNETVRTL